MRSQKAGLSGLFLCALVALAFVAMSPAAAEPIAIEVVAANAGYDQRTNEPVVGFTMSEPSRRLFADLTSRNVGRKLAIRVDGRLMLSPVIREPILGGIGQISSNLTTPQAADLAARLSSGQARLEFEVVD